MHSAHHVYCIFESAYYIHKIYFFALSKTIHCFLIKIVHCFLHKLFLAFCIKLFSIQHYLKKFSLSFLCKLFYVHYLKNCSLFSHKTPSEIVFSKFERQIWMLFMFKFHTEWICFSALIKSAFSHTIYLSRASSSWMIVSVYLPTLTWLLWLNRSVVIMNTTLQFLVIYRQIYTNR